MLYKIIRCTAEQKISVFRALYYLLVLKFKIVRCPVCGSYSFNDYYICKKCAWQYDSFLDEDGYSCGNRCTLSEYKERYENDEIK